MIDKNSISETTVKRAYYKLTPKIIDDRARGRILRRFAVADCSSVSDRIAFEELILVDPG